MNDSGETDGYRTLRERIHRGLQKLFGGRSRFVEYVLVVPDTMYLFYRLLSTDAVSFNHKALFLLAVFYLFTPFDLIPEVLFGPLGYLEDVPLTVVVFDLLLNQRPPRVVQRLWPGDPSVLNTIQRSVARANHWVGRGLWKKIRNRFD